MQRLGAIFIAICMVAISASVGAMLYYKFQLTIPEAAPISFGVLLTLLLVHYQINRVRDRMMIDEQMDDLTRLKLALTKEVQDVRELAQHLDENVTLRVENEVEPILAELDVIGTLVKQLAESCAELDERVQEGDKKADAVKAQMTSATQSVKQLEDLLRSNSRSFSSKNSESEKKTSQTESLDQSQSKPVSERKRDDLIPAKIEPEPQVSEEDEAAVRRALALGQLELFMQPIVALPMRKPQYYEALTRLKNEDGSLITPDVFLPVCRKNSFMPMLDRLAISEAFRLLRRLADRGRPVDCFCNISIASMADGDFFALMRTLFDENKDLSEHIILEFSQVDMRQFGIMEDETLQLLASMGFQFSVDQVTNLAVDFGALTSKGVRFAKVATSILTHRDAGRGMDIHPADFSRVLSRKGIDLVVTHVETERDLVGLIDYNIHLAQGNHFAAAKALKGAGEDGPSSGGSGRAASGAAGLSAPQPRQSRASSAGLRPQEVPAARVHGLGNRQEASPQETAGSGRTLGENPQIAQALKAMAAQEGDVESSRNQFRSALAEAAGLTGASSNAAPSRPREAPAVPPPSGRLSDRLPATDDFGLKTSTNRGQFLDLSEPATSPTKERRRANSDTQEEEPGTNRSDPGRFERLIR